MMIVRAMIAFLHPGTAGQVVPEEVAHQQLDSALGSEVPWSVAARSQLADAGGWAGALLLVCVGLVILSLVMLVRRLRRNRDESARDESVAGATRADPAEPGPPERGVPLPADVAAVLARLDRADTGGSDAARPPEEEERKPRDARRRGIEVWIGR